MKLFPRSVCVSAILLSLVLPLSLSSRVVIPVAVQTSPADFIIGPQVPIPTPPVNWFDQTEVTVGKKFGAQCGATPPATTDPAFNDYVLRQYYDLPLTMYVAWKRTGDPTFLDYARKCADEWWQQPQWIGSGSIRLWAVPGNESASPPPRHGGVGGLILRALDGRPEMWDWINAYTRFSLDNWLKSRISNPALYYGVREGAFALHYAVWLAQALPDSFPLQGGGTATNGAQLRAQYLADVEAITVNYFGRLQQSDGSWRWDDPDYLDHVSTSLTTPVAAGGTSLPVKPLSYPVQANMVVTLPGGTTKTSAAALAGATTLSVAPLSAAAALGDVSIEDGQLRGVMQPFMVGLLLNAEIDVYRLTASTTVKASIQSQLTKACTVLFNAAYRKNDPTTIPGINWRSFWYFKFGGTTVNPTKYENGGGSYVNADIATQGNWVINNERQAASTIFDVYAFTWLLTGDATYKTMGDELVSSTVSNIDGFHGFADADAKGYNQNYRMGGRYAAWIAMSGGVSLPTPSPTSTPTVTPTPVPGPSPTPIPSTSPSPAPLSADWKWPSNYTDQQKLRELTRQNGWRDCFIYNGRYWCVRQ